VEGGVEIVVHDILVIGSVGADDGVMEQSEDMGRVGIDEEASDVFVALAAMVADGTPIVLGGVSGVIEESDIMDNQGVGAGRERLQSDLGANLAQVGERDGLVVQEAIERGEVVHGGWGAPGGLGHRGAAGVDGECHLANEAVVACGVAEVCMTLDSFGKGVNGSIHVSVLLASGVG